MRILAAVLLALCGAFGYFWYASGQSSELSQKPDISRLQGIELRYQGKNPGQPLIFVKEEDTCSVGILAVDNHARAWILLYSPTTTRAYRSVVKPYQVTQRIIEKINNECNVSIEANQELRAHLNHPSL